MNRVRHPQPLQAAVARTSGPQPWRRVFHALTGLVIAVALTYGPWGARTGLLVMVSVTLVLLLFDLLRLSIPQANLLFFRALPYLASPREATGVASSTWYMAGITLALAAAPLPAAASGIVVLALADPAASYFGRRWGRRPFLGGSAEGSAVFAIVAFSVLAPRHGWPVAMAAALVATVLERRSWPLDDNLTLPVATALVIRLLET